VVSAPSNLDIEGYVRAFSRRRPDVDVAVLRFTNFIGPRIDSLLTGFFRMPVVPTALGYDARVQLLHEDDALAVLSRATTGDFVGTVNVGGQGTLLLSQAIRRLGRVELPIPTLALGSVGRLSRRFGFVDYSPEQMRFLNFGRVVDTTVLRTKFDYTPRYTTAAALEDYARTLDPVISPRLVESATAQARSVVSRVGDTATAVGERLNPAPPAPGLRAVRDA
jgi:UDP-glucose 4-epimerase